MSPKVLKDCIDNFNNYIEASKWNQDDIIHSGLDLSEQIEQLKAYLKYMGNKLADLETDSDSYDYKIEEYKKLIKIINNFNQLYTRLLQPNGATPEQLKRQLEEKDSAFNKLIQEVKDKTVLSIVFDSVALVCSALVIAIGAAALIAAAYLLLTNPVSLPPTLALMAYLGVGVGIPGLISGIIGAVGFGFFYSELCQDSKELIMINRFSNFSNCLPVENKQAKSAGFLSCLSVFGRKKTMENYHSDDKEYSGSERASFAPSGS